MPTLFPLVSVCLALFALPGSAQEFDSERPNIVLIGMRDLSLEELEAGPGFTALAAQGALIPKGEVTIPRGQPELAALMTGLMPVQTKVYLTNERPKLGNVTTLTELLRSEGYATYGAGKAPAAWEDLAFDASHFEVNPLSLEGRANLFGRIEELGPDQPFFLWWCPAAVAAKQATGKESDTRLGNLVQGLKRLRRHDNTLYVIVGLGAPDNNPSRQRSRASTRQSPFLFALGDEIQKGQVHDVLASSLDIVPTILDFAQYDAGGMQLSGSSLRPLLVDGAELKRERLHGALFSFMEDDPHPKSGRDKNLRNLTQLYSRDGRWKFVLYLQDVRLIVNNSKLAFNFSSGDQELYDLDLDPNEKLNLAGVPANAELVRSLRKSCLKWWKSTGANSPPLSSLIVPLEPKKKGDRKADPRPNIMLIIADDQDPSHLGFMGNELANMPTLDSLAESGAVFTTAHTASSRSRASLASLLSGRYPHQNKITASGSRAILRTRNSLPNLLKDAGYATFMGGRYYESNRYAMGFSSPQWEHVDNFVRKEQDSLIEFLDAQAKKRPFFIWWAPTIPSEPFNAPTRLRKPFEAVKVDIPRLFAGDRVEYVRQERELLAMEAWFDEGLTQVTKKIDELGQLDNTLFVFLSDNGASSLRPSRGSVFEKGLHTPIMFNLPGKVRGGLRMDDLVSTLDVFPTLLDYAEVEAPPGIAGHSLRAQLEGAAADPAKPREMLFGACYRAPRSKGRQSPDMDIYAVYARDKEWKYVLYVRNVTKLNTAILAPVGLFPARDYGEDELFQLSADPHEFKNLGELPEHAERKARMRAAAIEWWLSTGGKESKLLKQ